MGKKKNVKDPEYLLARADRLFKRGNYQLALTEFKKAEGLIRGKGIAERIETCRRLAEKAGTEDLIKKGKKYAGKGNIGEAIRCFKKAHETLGEDWLLEKIDQLEQRSRTLDMNRAAKVAEDKGQFAEAARLYGKLFEDSEKEFFLLKKAHCLVRAGMYEEAVSIFQGCEPDYDWALYDHGFALARMGRFYECLRTWDGLSSQDIGFTAQRDEARGLLVEDLYKRFEEDRDFKGIYVEGKYLLESAGAEALRDLVEYCEFAWIEDLWDQERYETIDRLLADPHTKTGAALAGLRAKTAFKLMEASGDMSGLSMFWLTALYGEVFDRFPCPPDKKEEVRSELVRLAEDMIKDADAAGDSSAKGRLSLWETEKKLVEDLRRIKDEEGNFHAVCTPQYAIYSGLSSEVLKYIWKNRKTFKEREDYLTLGSYYSLAGKSLLLVERSEYEEAIACLPDINDPDEFTGYGIMRVKFAYGMHSLEEGGDKKAFQYFDTAAKLFDIAPAYEARLVEKALDADHLNDLDSFFEILSRIHEKRDSGPIKKALSLVMSRRAIEMYNEGQMTDKALHIAMKKALDLNPENEHAIGGLKDTRLDLEILEMRKALKRHKMNRACKLASGSEHPEVREEFFLFFINLIEGLDQAGLSPQEQILALNDFYSLCSRVDNTHPILEEIEYMLEELKQEPDNESLQGIRSRY